ncbi:hypothetical protein [Methylobacterium symbioticum]|uniref:Uncharacterized protein n=1 Tax=Methylobacterium symbioticum TaxID=2584084 RepID=A0A509ECC6_9HYPH|nr:hypothetical protein [Methylobacterium symbioticum]VUD71828.1 hypothetical protein MET9862_02416 [Methylobacterium symbioticum]
MPRLALIFPVLLALLGIGAFAFAAHLRTLAARGELQVLHLGGER